MSEENDWNHRSQFKDVTDPGLRAVTANYNARRYGKVEQYHPTRDNHSTKDESEPDEAARRTDWEDGFEPRHLSSGKYTDGAKDTRSNRERLKAGETV